MWISKKRLADIESRISTAESTANYCRHFMNERVSETVSIINEHRVDGESVGTVVELLLRHLNLYVHKPSAKPVLRSKGGPEIGDDS